MYEDQIKLKGESKAEEKDQSFKDVRKSEDKMSQERRRLDSAKIGISKDLVERRENIGRVRKKKSEKKIKIKTCSFLCKRE
jgi:hypothetical protein